MKEIFQAGAKLMSPRNVGWRKFGLMLVLYAASAICLTSAAGTVYVDNGLQSYTGHDGTSWAMAFKTIQEGVDAAADGDTVLVAPGVYGDEQGTRASSLSGATLTTRVLLPSSKAVTVKSSKGKAQTHIVGRKGADAAGTGSGAIAGFVIENLSGGKGKDSRVEGFTIREVAPSANARGGGVSFLPNPGDRTAMASLPWVVDCVVSNASASSGILGNVNCARTWVTDITVNGNNTSCGQNINAIHSVFTHCQGIALAVCNTIANCYFADHGNRVTSVNPPMKIYNTIIQFAGSRIDAKDGYDYQDNIFDSGSIYVDTGKTPPSGTLANTLVKGGSQIVNLPLGDFRPLASHSYMGSESYKAGAANHGSAAWLELFPEEFRYIDFYGKPFTPENGKVHAGASQELVTPKSCLKLQGSVALNGSPKTVRSFECQVYSDTWPVIYRLTPNLGAGQKLVYFQYSTYLTDTNVGYANIKPATKGDSALLVPESTAVNHLFAVKAAKEFWVDRSAAAGGTGTEDAPFRTIQEAVTATGTSTSYVHVARGVYDEGETLLSGSTSNRVQIMAGCYRFVATDGPENTVIKGAADSSEPDSGCGPAAVRCICTENIPAVFEGFTLTDGHVSSSDASTGSTANRGAAFYGGGTRTALVNCIVTNNCSPRIACMYKGVAYRCRFLDNRVTASYESFFVDVRMGACLVGRHDVPVDNMCFFDGSTYVTHCTIRNYTNKNMVLLSAHNHVFNTIVNHARNNSANANQKRILGCVFNDFAYNSNINTNGIQYIKADPLFVDDTEHGDWRLFADSPAVGYGNAWDGLGELGNATAYEAYYALVTHDLAGDEPFFMDGKPTSGAYQRPARIAVPVAPKGSSFSFTGVEDGTIAFDEPVTVTLDGGAREAYGLEVGGVAADGVSATFTPSEVFTSGKTLDVRALVSTNWYVDAVNGVDDAAHHGRIAEAAKKTLEAAFACADSGDVVHALPGTYDEGSMKSSESIILRSRVFIPEGVRLVSTDGAAATTIKGLRKSNGIFNFLGGLSDSNTLMRCVTMAPNTELRGFTLLEGGTFSNNCPVATGTENRYGGGVYVMEEPTVAKPSVLVRDCLIKNCGATYGGGGYRGVYERCRFLGTMAQQGCGAATYDAAVMRNCIVDGVRAATSIDQPCLVVNCTIGKNNRNAGGNGPEGTGTLRARYDGRSQLVNILFLGGTAGIPVNGCTNCVVPTANYLTSAYEGERPGLIVAQVEVDENYRPVAGSANIDAGANFSLSGDPEETDIYGTQRVYNGTVDIGAVEHDWRPQYKADLGGSRRLDVSAASSNVLHTASGVQLSDAQTLEATWISAGGTSSCEWTVAQEGEGTLWLAVNGGEEEPVSPGVIKKHLAAGEHVFAFRFDGAGNAYLTNFADLSGTMLIFR